MAESNKNTDASMESRPTGTNSEMDLPDQSLQSVSDPGMEKFLQNSRRDLMYELRRIQHGDRPVTGQGHRESINSFFSKRLEVVRSQKADGNENIPSNVDEVATHRPEAVTVEVQGLFEQRPVSSVLQSAAFRRHLEHIIRGSIASITSRSSSLPPQPTLRTSLPRRSHNASPLLPQSHRSSPASSVSSLINQDTLARSRSGSHDSATSLISSQGSADGLDGATARPDEVPLHSHTSDHQAIHDAPQDESVPFAPNLPGPAVESNARSIIDQQHVPVHPVEVNVSAAQVSDLINEQREVFIEDVSELLHRRLVSSTLEGEFRGVLEVHLQERAQSTGSDGPRVQQFIRSIPQTDHHVRNDFSDINIANGAGADNWDNISVTSISTHALPYTQTNAYMSREMQALKAQMHEMQSMMRLSFDLQMDIQRAIRQEVSAALANVMGASAITHPPASVPVQDSHCLICLDNYTDAVLYQCGHMCVCYSCGKTLMSRGSSCPLCRAPIRDIIRAYKASTE